MPKGFQGRGYAFIRQLFFCAVYNRHLSLRLLFVQNFFLSFFAFSVFLFHFFFFLLIFFLLLLLSQSFHNTNNLDVHGEICRKSKFPEINTFLHVFLVNMYMSCREYETADTCNVVFRVFPAVLHYIPFQLFHLNFIDSTLLP